MSIFDSVKSLGTGESKMFDEVGGKVFGEFANDIGKQNPGDFINIINIMGGGDAGASKLLPGLDLFEGGGAAGAGGLGDLGGGVSSLLGAAGQFLPMLLKVLPSLLPLLLAI